MHYIRFDTVHCRGGGKRKSVIFYSSLSEFLKCCRNIGAVITFRVVFSNTNPVAIYEHAVCDVVQSRFELFCSCQERRKTVGCGIVRQILMKG